MTHVETEQRPGLSEAEERRLFVGLLAEAQSFLECSAINLSRSSGRGARRSSSDYFDLSERIRAALSRTEGHGDGE